jgi:hypothetical protein
MSGRKANSKKSVKKLIVLSPESRSVVKRYRERKLRQGTLVPSDEIAINELILAGDAADVLQ